MLVTDVRVNRASLTGYELSVAVGEVMLMVLYNKVHRFIISFVTFGFVSNHNARPIDIQRERFFFYRISTFSLQTVRDCFF